MLEIPQRQQRDTHGAGSYPDVGPKKVPDARDPAKSQKPGGRDPVMMRKVEMLNALTPAGATFKATALAWYEVKLDSWSSHNATRGKRKLEKDLFPALGNRHIGEIGPTERLATLRRVEERGALNEEHQVLTTTRQVRRYALATVALTMAAQCKTPRSPRVGGSSFNRQNFEVLQCAAVADMCLV